MNGTKPHNAIRTVVLIACVMLSQSAIGQEPGAAPESQINVCKFFPERYANKPLVANVVFPNDFTEEIAVVTCSVIPPEKYVVGIVDLTEQCNAMLGWSVTSPEAWEPPMYHNEWPGNPTNDPLDEWNRTNLGTVFGLTLDDAGDIFVTASSCYRVDLYPTVHGPGTGGEIYRIDGQTGKISLLTGSLPNSGQGLGNITYDGVHDQFFVSNMDDGLIYRISGDGTFLGAVRYDHGVTGRAAVGLSTIPDNNSPDFTPPRAARLGGGDVD